MANPKWYYIFPPSLLAVAIYLVCLAPPDEIQKIHPWAFPGADKLDHFVAFGTLSLLVIRGWQREKMPPIDLHLFVWLLCTFYGIVIEVQQLLGGVRSFEVADILADAIGALLGQSVWHLLMLRWGKRTRLYPGLFRPDFKTSKANRKK